MAAFVNYTTMTVRASGATSGTSGQDTAVDLPETVTEFWVVVTKTVEANADNVLTVRLQSQVGSAWFDVSWDSITGTQTLTVATDITADVTRKVNIVDENTDPPTYSILAHYRAMPSNTIRTVWVASGTTPSHTFSATALYQLNKPFQLGPDWTSATDSQ